MSTVNEKVFNILKAIFYWPSKKGTPPAAPDHEMKPDLEQGHEWNSIYQKLHEIDQEESFKEVVQGKPIVVDIPDPELILGPGGSKWVNWDHADDLFVNFSVAESLVVEDPDFMVRYILNDLSPKEREISPPSYHQCFADISEVVFANLNFNMVEIKDDHYGFLVGIGNTLGMLILRTEDSIDVIRRSNGFVDNEKAMHYHMQFMRFHPEAINRIGPCSEVKDWPSTDPDFEMIVNFAHFEEPEEVPVVKEAV